MKDTDLQWAKCREGFPDEGYNEPFSGKFRVEFGWKCCKEITPGLSMLVHATVMNAAGSPLIRFEVLLKKIDNGRIV